MKKNINENTKNRFRMLCEYDFYIGEDEENVELDGDIITEAPPEESGEEDPFAEEGGEELAPEEDGEEFGDEEGEDPFGGAEGGDDFGGEEALPEPEPMEDEIDIDVTELVQNTEAAKVSADNATQQINNLLSKFDEMESHLDKMSSINTKIDNLENEIEKRNPTPEENLEMRSMDSYPYNLKLTDYWSEKEGAYDVMKEKKAKDSENYVLTQDEVDGDYNDIHVRDSFDTEEKNTDFNQKITY